jgi:hypothetical protein
VAFTKARVERAPLPAAFDFDFLVLISSDIDFAAPPTIPLQN